MEVASDMLHHCCIAPCEVIVSLYKWCGMLTVFFIYVGVGHACAS